MCEVGHRGVSQSHLNRAGTQRKLSGFLHSQGIMGMTAVSHAPMGTMVLCRRHLAHHCPWVLGCGRRLSQRNFLLSPIPE